MEKFALNSKLRPNQILANNAQLLILCLSCRNFHSQGPKLWLIVLAKTLGLKAKEANFKNPQLQPIALNVHHLLLQYKIKIQ